MKKFATLLLLIVMAAGCVFAVNYQKIYSIDDDIMRKVQNLYRLNGKAMPSSSGPWSGSEISEMLDVLEPSKMDDTEYELYCAVRKEIDSDAQRGVYNIGLLANVELSLHTNLDTVFQGRDNWVRNFNKDPQLLNVLFDHNIRENFYGYFEINLGPARHYADPEKFDFGSNVLSSNIMFLTGNGMREFDFNFPRRAFLSAGGEGWSVQFGRDRIRWGNGTTGNLIIGDHTQHHNMIRVAAWDSGFKYTFLVSGFPHPQNYYGQNVVINDDGETQTGVFSHGLPNPNGYLGREDGGNPDNYVSEGQSKYLNGISAFISHRLEAHFFKNRLGLALTEGVMYMSKDNKIDLMAFAPSLIYHNNYTRSNTNSILGLEADYTIFKGFNVYAQVAIDEFCLVGEPKPGDYQGYELEDGQSVEPTHQNKDNTLAEPTAIGLIAGIKYSTVVNKGVFTANFEFAQTDPYLYLRDGDRQSNDHWRQQDLGQYGINYVVAVREMVGAGGTEYYDEQFLGYKYGGDAQVFNLNIAYERPRWNVIGNIFAMRHGTFDKWTLWTRVNKFEGDNPKTPTTTHKFVENQKDPDAQENRNSVETTLVAGVSGSYAFDFGLSLFGQADFVGKFNANNIKSAPMFDFQFTLGATYKY